MGTLYVTLLQLESLRQLFHSLLMETCLLGSIFKMATEFWTKQGC